MSDFSNVTYKLLKLTSKEIGYNFVKPCKMT